MDFQKEAGDMLTRAETHGYERGYREGVEAALTAVGAVARANDPKPPKKPRAKVVKGGASKTGRAVAVIKQMPADEKIRRATIDQAVMQAGDLDKAAAGNAIQKMVKSGELVALPDGQGYRLPAPNGAAVG